MEWCGVWSGVECGVVWCFIHGDTYTDKSNFLDKSLAPSLHLPSPSPPPSHLLHPYKMLNCNKMNLLHVKCTRSYKYNHSRRVACIAAMRIEEEVRGREE